MIHLYVDTQSYFCQVAIARCGFQLVRHLSLEAPLQSRITDT